LPSHLEIVPLGGLGEFGMNLMVYRCGEDCLVVDAGMMFPGQEHLGVDVVIPDLSFLDDCGTIHGVILTHGHEDHIGALPYLLARHEVPVYASEHTRALIAARLAEHDALAGPELRALPDAGRALRLGPFSVECIQAAHSIPQSRMLLIDTPPGRVLHTADFKLDPAPADGMGTDVTRLAALGGENVLALLCDSTNADCPGFTPSESSVERGIDALLQSAKRRVLVTTFASNVSRIQALARLARRHRRRIALVGTALEQQAQIAERLGLLEFGTDLRLSPSAAMELPPQRVMLVATGSQGEPMSALARIAVGNHREVELQEGDLVIHSARTIPGNEQSIGRMINHLMRRGAEVVTASEAMVHASGHASGEELRILLSWVRPRYLVPIHGEYRQLRAHARLAVGAGLPKERVCLAESGHVVALSPDEIRVADRVHVGQVFIDATLDRVDRDLLRDRRRSAGDGIVVSVVAVDREGGAVDGYPEIVTRGFVPGSDDGAEAWLREARQVVIDCLHASSPAERGDEAILKAKIQTHLKRFLRRKTQRQPLIIPVIVEL